MCTIDVSQCCRTILAYSFGHLSLNASRDLFDFANPGESLAGRRKKRPANSTFKTIRDDDDRAHHVGHRLCVRLGQLGAMLLDLFLASRSFAFDRTFCDLSGSSERYPDRHQSH